MRTVLGLIALLMWVCSSPVSAEITGIYAFQLNIALETAIKGTSVHDGTRFTANHGAIKLKDGRVLLLSGVCPSSVSNPKRSDVYEPKTNRITSTGPQVFGYQGSATVLLASGNVFTCGAMSGAYGAQIFVAKNNKFIDAGPMKEPRANQAACVLGDGSVLIAGGQHVAFVSDETQPLKTTEIFRE